MLPLNSTARSSWRKGRWTSSRWTSSASRPGHPRLGVESLHFDVISSATSRDRLGDAAAEVPSPSYTLVNVYETPQGEIWHADLYRLGGVGETAELGLDDAGAAVLLVEWPDRMGEDAPARRIEIALVPQPDESRRAEIRCVGGGWEAALAALAPWI